MSKVIALYHIVFCTYERHMTIPEESKRELYRYIFGILRNNGCHLWRMNGIGNHIHILISLPSTISLATLVQKVKQSSSLWLKNNPLFPHFYKWAKEYYAATISFREREGVIEYIRNQEEHHLHGRSVDMEIEDLYENE